MPKLRVYVDADLPKTAEDLADLNRALMALTRIHGVDPEKVSLQWSSQSKQVSAFYPTNQVLPVNG
jgi:hypothetical protein